MGHRERVIKTLNHQEPDRVPIDFGGTGDSTISAMSYQDLRGALGLGPGTTRILDVAQYSAVIDEDVRQALGVDTKPVFDLPVEWRKDTMPDGAPVELPAGFLPRLMDDGSQVVFDATGNTVLKMPKGGYYFDPVYSPLADATGVEDIDRCLAQIEQYDRPQHLDRTYEDLASIAQELRDNTDYLLVGYFGGHIFQAAQSLRGWELFLFDLLTNRKFAEALLDRLAEANVRRFEHYAATVGQHVDVIHFEDDLGMQDRPLMSPSLYRQAVKPYHQKLFGFAKSRCDAYILLHTDGAVEPFIPDFIEMGVDALNPVQVSAAGMDTQKLKREYGRDITFWGGGCESQTILPYGTPAEVTEEVKRRIEELAPGGGYVFAPIHNVQLAVPIENTVAMFDAVRERGRY